MKNFLTSKTLWFNVLTFVLAGFGGLGDISVLSPEILLVINALGNFLLRLVTSKALSLKK